MTEPSAVAEVRAQQRGPLKIGRIVHYNFGGDTEHVRACRPAVVSRVHGHQDASADLTVLSATENDPAVTVWNQPHGPGMSSAWHWPDECPDGL